MTIAIARHRSPSLASDAAVREALWLAASEAEPRRDGPSRTGVRALGSVSELLVHTAPCSVLVAPDHE